MIKVLFVSHAYVEKDNRQKLTDLASKDDLEIGVIYPQKWRTWHGEDKVQPGVASRRSGINLTAPDGAQISYREYRLGTWGGRDAGRYVYSPVQLIESIFRFRPDLIYIEEEPFSLVCF